jgi:hypothetical protein
MPKHLIENEGGTITRDGDGKVETIEVEGQRNNKTITITRDGNGKVASTNDGTRTITITRDGDDKVSGWVVS